MKKCNSCGNTKTNRHFKLEPKNKDGLTNRCRDCIDYQYRYWRHGKEDPTSLYGYLKSLKSKSSYCMRCGRLFNYVEPEGKRRKKRLLPYEAEYHKGFWLCEECYRDELKGKKFNVSGKWHLITDISIEEYNKLYKDYINPREEK